MRATWTDRRWNGLLFVLLLFAAWACADDGEGCDDGGCDACDCDGDGEPSEPANPFPPEGVMLPGGAQVRVGQALLDFIGDTALDLLPELAGDDLPIRVEGERIYFCFERDSFPIDGVGNAEICADRNCGARFGNLPGCLLFFDVEDLSIAPRSPDNLDVVVTLNQQGTNLALDQSIRARIRVLFNINCDVRLRADAAAIEFSMQFEENAPGLTRLVPNLDLNFANLRATISGGFLSPCGLGQGAIDDFVEDIPGLFGDLLGDFLEGLPEFVEIQGAFNLGDLLGGLLGGLGDDPADEPSEPGASDPEPSDPEPSEPPAPDPDAIVRLLSYYVALGGFAYAEDNPQGGLSLGLLTGFHADPDLCVPLLPPPFPDGAVVPPSPTLHAPNAPDGTPVGVGIGLHRDALDLALWAVHQSGALCLELGAEDIEFLSTGTLGLLLPTLEQLSDGVERPMRIVLRPTAAPTVTLGSGAELITLALDDIAIDFYVFTQDRYVRFLTLDADIRLPLGLDVDGDGNLTPLLGDLGQLLQRVEARNAGLLAESETQVLVELLPTVIGLLIPGLSDDLLPSIELPELLGFRLVLSGENITAIDDATMLAIFAGLELAPPIQEMRAVASLERLQVEIERPTLAHVAAHMAEVQRGAPFSLDAVRPRVHLTVPHAGQGMEVGWRIAGSPWSQWASGPRVTIDDPRLGTPGEHIVEVRARLVGAPGSVTPQTRTVHVRTDFLAPVVRVVPDGLFARVQTRDDQTPVARLERRVFVDGQPVGGFTRELGPIDLRAWAGREITLEVQVRDEAGNVGKTTRSLSVPAVRTPGTPDTGADGPGASPASGCSAAGGGPAGAALWWGLALLLVAVRRRVGIVLAAALLLAACGSDGATGGDRCTGDGDCADAERCIEGICTLPVCTEDADCGAGGTCVEGQCLGGSVGGSAPGCATDFDCPDGGFCIDSECVTVEVPDRCANDSACPGADVCVAGRCVSAPAECVTNNMCGPAERCESGACVPRPVPPACFDDVECPADEVCRDGGCLPASTAPECLVDLDCPSGDRCVDNGCEAPVCRTSAECEAPCDNGATALCFDGDCFCGFPCADGCPSGTFCCHDTDRCVAEPWACAGIECPPGTSPVVRTAATANSRTCAVDAPGECACVPRPPVEPGRIGRWISADAHGDTFAVAAWNETYRDLMVGLVNADGVIEWTHVDGIPTDGRVVGDPQGPRWGIAEPGPDAGRHTATAVGADGTVHVIWHVESGPEGRALRYGVRAADGSWDIRDVDTEGGGGLYGAIALDEDGLPLIVYMAPAVQGTDGWAAELRAATPGASGFDRVTLARQPISTPCGAGCGTTEACDAAQDRCRATISNRWCGGCGEGEACFRGDSPGAFACGRVATLSGLQTLPEGTGLFAAMTQAPSGAFRIAFYNSVEGRLYRTSVERENLVHLDPEPLDGGEGRDAGRFAALTATDSGVLAAWIDETRREVLVENLTTGTRVLVDDGVRLAEGTVVLSRVGPSARFLDCGGQTALVYQNATAGTLELTRLGAAGWSEPEAIGGHGDTWDGFWAFGLGIAPRADGPRIVSNTLYNEGHEVRILAPEACRVGTPEPSQAPSDPPGTSTP